MNAGVVQLIVCDWNGTVVDDARRGLASTNAVLQAFDLPRQGIQAFRQRFLLPLDEYFRSLGIPQDAIPLAVYLWNNELARHPARLRHGVTHLLDRAAAASTQVGVLSAARYDVVAADARRLGIFDQLAFVRGDVSAKATALAEIVVEAHGQVAYVGDTEHDIRAAQEAGALPLGVTGGYRPASALRKAGAKLVVSDFKMLGERLLSRDGRRGTR